MGAGALGAAGGIRMAVRLTITARKLKPLIRKQVPSPTTASSTPAMAGPTTRAALNVAELSEMALMRSSLLVIWITSAWRPGMSKALITPSAPASTSNCQTWTRPVRVSAASTKACTIDRVWVTMTTFWRGKRSAAMPPSGPSANTAIWEQNQAVPNRSSEWVRRYTSQLSATFCIQVPTSETIWPPIKRRKLRWRRARKVCGTRLGASGGIGGSAGSSPKCGGETPILIFQNNARYNEGSIIRRFQEKIFWRTINCIKRSTWAAAPSRSPSPSEKRSRCVNRRSGTRAAARASRPRAPMASVARHRPFETGPFPFPSRAMKITELVLHPIAVADPPLRSSYGLHAPFALRTIVELKTDSGLTGFSETYGGDGPLAGLEAVRARVTGMDPFQLAGLWRDLSREAEHTMANAPGGRSQTYLVPGENPLDRHARTFAAIEIACLDLIGKATGKPVCDVIGGRVRDEVSFSAYLFYKHGGGGGVGGDAREDEYGEVLTPEACVRECRQMTTRYGFREIKLKGGVLDPAIEMESIRALRREFGPKVPLRIDPNCAWSVDTTVAVGRALQDELADGGYLEDGGATLEGMGEGLRGWVAEQ